jgi:hypothetical protein
VEHTPTHHNGHSAKFIGPSVDCYLDKAASTFNPCYARCYMYLPAMLSNSEDIRVIYLFDSAWSAVARCGIVIGGAGTKYWRLQTPQGNWNLQDDTISIEKWYCIELYWAKATGAGNNGVATLYIDGVQKITNSTETSTNNMRLVYFGNCASWTPTGFVTNIDCCVVDTAYIGIESSGIQKYCLLEMMGY